MVECYYILIAYNLLNISFVVHLYLIPIIIVLTTTIIHVWLIIHKDPILLKYLLPSPHLIRALGLVYSWPISIFLHNYSTRILIICILFDYARSISAETCPKIIELEAPPSDLNPNRNSHKQDECVDNESHLWIIIQSSEIISILYVTEVKRFIGKTYSGIFLINNQVMIP